MCLGGGTLPPPSHTRGHKSVPAECIVLAPTSTAPAQGDESWLPLSLPGLKCSEGFRCDWPALPQGNGWGLGSQRSWPQG